MRGLRVSSNGTSTKGLAEINHHHVRSEQKKVRDGGTGGGKGLSEEEECRIIDDVDANSGHKDLVQQQPPPLSIQQRPQGSAASWQQFLPFGSLKVLLVEFDDATRHVVSALLRNCNYEVTAVSNCIEAWKVLQDLTNHVDLVLTEVAMPYLSGIGLLSKIKNHKTCKNIPVIMMSANDSMGIVFKCLSKGAVDFLVKPIRKNELKNLWQHVWRKCQSSSGSASGSESCIRTQKFSKSKSVEGTGNNNASNGEDDIASISLNDRNGSDNGSGTQTSWTKRAVEVDSPKPMSPSDELADAPDSTCAQVMHLTPEAFSNNWMPTASTMELLGNNKLDDIAMGKDLEIGIPRNPDLQRKEQIKDASLPVPEAQEKRKNLESEIEKGKAILDKGKTKINGGTSNDKPREAALDSRINVINCADPQMMDGVAALSKTNIKNEGTYNNINDKEMPSVELSLKRPRDVGEVEVSAREQNVLKRSNLSAFSRYNTTPTATNQTPTGIVGSCSPNGLSSEGDKTENLLGISQGTPNQRSNGSSNNNDMGSTTNNTFAVPVSRDKTTVPKPSAVNICPSSASQPTTTPVDAAAAVNTVIAQANGVSSQVQVQHHHHHYHHYHHHVHKPQQKKPTKGGDDLAMTATPVEGNVVDCSLNGSASGSYNGSNGKNGSSNVVVTEGANNGSENGLLAANSEAEAGGGSGSGVDQSRYAHREAALNKFRQKRKERCFDKKVRYQSRKKLAEQRPRVRGQFVRQQGVNDNKSKETDC